MCSSPPANSDTTGARCTHTVLFFYFVPSNAYCPPRDGGRYMTHRRRSHAVRRGTTGRCGDTIPGRVPVSPPRRVASSPRARYAYRCSTHTHTYIYKGMCVCARASEGVQRTRVFLQQIVQSTAGLYYTILYIVIVRAYIIIVYYIRGVRARAAAVRPDRK